MAYSDWLNSTTKYSAPNASYLPPGFPLDYRTLQETKANVFGLAKSQRHPGLKVYVVADGIEYIYTAKIEDGEISFPHENIKEYHPELVHVGIVDPDNRPVKPDSEPAEYYTDAELLRNPTVLLGDGIVTYSNKSYNTIPEGAEGTLKTTDNKYYKYVWNGSEWVMFANSGSGGSNAVILNFASDIDVSGNSDSPVYLSSIYALNSNYISSAYKDAMGLDVNDTIASGSEANVVFTDKTTNPYVEYCRKYVYLNGAWRIVQGVQEYVITLPAYADAEWFDGYNPKNSMVIDPNDDSANVDVMVSSNKGTVDVIISHQFNSQYVDAFVFEKNTTEDDIDGGSTPETEYGDRLLVPVKCFKSAEDNQFKVKISLPVSTTSTTTYAITLQK